MLNCNRSQKFFWDFVFDFVPRGLCSVCVPAVISVNIISLLGLGCFRHRIRHQTQNSLRGIDLQSLFINTMREVHSSKILLRLVAVLAALVLGAKFNFFVHAFHHVPTTTRMHSSNLRINKNGNLPSSSSFHSQIFLSEHRLHGRGGKRSLEMISVRFPSVS
jgi:hypothetical protein